jgi:hypothetical protein
MEKTKHFWSVVYYLGDRTIPFSVNFKTRKEARRFKKNLKSAPLSSTVRDVSMRQAYMSVLGGFVVSPIKEY